MPHIIKLDAVASNAVFAPNACDDSTFLVLCVPFYFVAEWTRNTFKSNVHASSCVCNIPTPGNHIALSNSVKQTLMAYSPVIGVLEILDLQTKEQIARLAGHTNYVIDIKFSIDDRLLASTSSDSTVRLWDVTDPKNAFIKSVMHGHTDTVVCLSFSPDVRQLASGSQDGTVRVWSIIEGTPEHVLQHTGRVNCVAFSPAVKDTLLASGCRDCTIRVWNVSGLHPQLVHELYGHDDIILTVAFSPDGCCLVSGSLDSTVRVWNMTYKKIHMTLRGHKDTVTSVTFHPNGKQVLSCSYDKTMYLWTVCDWSDRNNYLFSIRVRKVIFAIICIKTKLETTDCGVNHTPHIPMELWLHILSIYVTRFRSTIEDYADFASFKY